MRLFFLTRSRYLAGPWPRQAEVQWIEPAPILCAWKDNRVLVTQGRWKETKVELAFPSFLHRRQLCQWGNLLYLPSVLNYSLQCRISASSSMHKWKLSAEPVLTVLWLVSYVGLLLAVHHFQMAPQILSLLLIPDPEICSWMVGKNSVLFGASPMWLIWLLRLLNEKEL